MVPWRGPPVVAAGNDLEAGGGGDPKGDDKVNKTANGQANTSLITNVMTCRWAKAGFHVTWSITRVAPKPSPWGKKAATRPRRAGETTKTRRIGGGGGSRRHHQTHHHHQALAFGSRLLIILRPSSLCSRCSPADSRSAHCEQLLSNKQQHQPPPPRSLKWPPCLPSQLDSSPRRHLLLRRHQQQQ